ncbi:hypothetical protein IFM89_022141 [Coptis chinensis]|uniref:Serine/threonine-protein kinase ATM n=1 Tax=Coptis chinensis TaxID=261450 RepID=A0A835MFM3_9MAGN|nr:hypothetical protein IFM89_022141 [Coptis chinensis]
MAKVNQRFRYKLLECSVELLAEIEKGSDVKAMQSESQHIVRLPCRISDPLRSEMETYILAFLTDNVIDRMLLSDIFFLCTLICNCIYSSIIASSKEENSTFHLKLCQHVVMLLQRALCLVEECQNDLQSRGGSGCNLFLDGTGSILASVRGFVCGRLLSLCRDQTFNHDMLARDIIEAMERFLKALAKLFKGYSGGRWNVHSEVLSESVSSEIDADLDLNKGSNDMDAKGKCASGIPLSSVKWKFDVISVVASFFVVLPVTTWEIMLDLMENENDIKVCENILCCICEQFQSSPAGLSDLVFLMNDMIEVRMPLNLCSVDILIAIRSLLKALISMRNSERDSNANLSPDTMSSGQSLASLGDLVNKIADVNALDWNGRVVLIDCICNLVILDPHIGQGMIEQLLRMLQDTDYRVRLFLAKRIGVLFLIWDGHDELFVDICSNFGVKMVMSSKGKLVTAAEVRDLKLQPCSLRMETVTVTLAHLAFHSEKIEVEAIFMMCVVAAIHPCQRELVRAILENLSRKLQYTARSKYLEELMGSILFSWVACGVGLIELMEVRDLFVLNSEPNYFMQYCCPWLLPALILSGSTADLKKVSKVAAQPLTVLAKNHFVPIFAICMALHCSKKPGMENGVSVLQGSLLHIAEMSDNERDHLIKKHMVSIVSFLLSLSSSASDPANPFFSKDVIVLAVQTVVDGFMEMEDRPENVGIVDKINVFRADRVFMFIVEMHYKITAAVHHRHKCHRLSAIEVLINIIGHRAAFSSTSNYLFNLVGQFIGCQALQEQCCVILSKLLEVFKNNPTKDITSVLGEQLQFLVSKLIACCIPSESTGELSGVPPPQVLSLLHQLTVSSDPSLFDYIRELEPFPEINCFDGIRTFHQELCKAYSPRDHFLKFVRRTSYLPQRLLLWSLRTVHRKLLMGEIIFPEKDVKNTVEKFNSWRCEPEIVSAVWTLVGMCNSTDTNNISGLVSDFISRVGIGDPHCVVFHLPGEAGQVSPLQVLDQGSDQEVSFKDSGMPDGLLITLIRVLKKYLLDDSVSTIDMTSRALQGILSTERGQRALLSFDSYERSLIEVHSKGVNMELVEKLLSHSERKSNVEATAVHNSSLWMTHGKTYEMWICRLVYSLIDHTNDIILRLCQDIVLLKAEVAELLLSNILVNLAGRKDLSVDICKSISLQAQEYIFNESNELIKSVQIMLNALNELRSYHVMERATTSSTPVKRESSKYDKSSSYSSRSRCTLKKSINLSAMSSAALLSTFSWEKVYWLSIDYLQVAKSAIQCGSYFTSVMYVEHWCEEQFNSLTLGSPDFSSLEVLLPHIEILVSAVTRINEPDSLYGIIHSHKLTSQIITYEHEGNWSKALEYYDLQVRAEHGVQTDGCLVNLSQGKLQEAHQVSLLQPIDEMRHWKSYKGLMRSLQQTGCTHLLDLYCQGLTSQKGQFHHDLEFTELQYEAAWRAGNWDFSLLCGEVDSPPSRGHIHNNRFNEKLHGCLRALQEGDSNDFHMKLTDSKQVDDSGLLTAVLTSRPFFLDENYTVFMDLPVKMPPLCRNLSSQSIMQARRILDQLGIAWGLRWKSSPYAKTRSLFEKRKMYSEPIIPTSDQMETLNTDWSFILMQTQLHMNLLEPFIAFRRVLLQILSCKDCILQNLLESSSTLRKGSRFSLSAAALHEFKFLNAGAERQLPTPYICCLGRIEEAKLLRAQGQHEMAINLARHILHHYQLNGEASNVHRLVGKWLAETRSSNSRTILEQYLKHAVDLAKLNKSANKKGIARECQTHFHLAHYADALFRSYEERLNSNEWQAAMRLRKHKGEKTDYSMKIQELQKQLSMDRDEAERLQDDRDNFLGVALEGYQRCLVIGDKYDVRVVFRIVSLWFSLSSRQNVINGMLSTVKEVQSYKFIPLVYQIASRMGSLKDGQGAHSFQYALISLLKKMAVDHPYHTIFQTKQMVDIYIKLAELETRREDTNKKMPLPREIRNLRQLELVPVVTATFPVDRSCQYCEGSFPHFKGFGDSIMVMNGINAPKVVECFGSDGHKYRQLAKSGNDDLRQDAVMEQFFSLVNTFLQNHRDTWRRRLGIRTYKVSTILKVKIWEGLKNPCKVQKLLELFLALSGLGAKTPLVVPFTPSAGVLEWVDGTVPLGEYLLGSLRNGGAHGRYGVGDWSFLKCREEMANAKDKCKAFQKVCENFRPVMHYFFLERFLQPANWFERRLCYARSVAASSMVGYIVGLGDRHSMNILIDQVTAEVVHIDLGVAFEQGLMLKTPERVPFRLTRDIIDGMGVTGVEGVFRRCCEETLSVMRMNKEALLTIIEVFIHDPLYKWALSPLKALQLQKGDGYLSALGALELRCLRMQLKSPLGKEPNDDFVSSLEDSQDVYEGNKDAARALMRVKQKLDGYEEGEMRSVHGQVQQLIQDAIDPDRLCQMFPGWGSWL